MSKGRQIFLYVAPFPALAAFKIWAANVRQPGDLLIASCVLVVYCCGILFLAARWHKPSYFDWAVAIYFGLVTLFLAVWPSGFGNLITSYAVTGIYLCLFSAAFFPLLLGMDPFTYHYAKQYTPRMFGKIQCLSP